MKILAIDPGVTTGMARLNRTPDKFEIIETWEEKFSHRDFWDELHIEVPNLIIIENFIHTQVSRVNLYPAELIGIASLFVEIMHWVPIQLVKQNPDKRKWWTMEKIKAINLWESGKPHAMDALKHLLVYETFTAGNQKYIAGLKKLINKV